jgi:hypothetical protein
VIDKFVFFPDKGNFEDAYKSAAEPDNSTKYARALLNASVFAIKSLIKGSTPIEPEVVLVLPPPPLFEASFRPRIYYTFMQENMHKLKNINTWSELIDTGNAFGSKSFGIIKVNDSLPITLIYLTETVDFLLERSGDPNYDGPKINANVVSNVKEVFKFWDNWRPEIQLDITRHVPSLYDNLPMDDLTVQVIKDGVRALEVPPLSFVTGHEYGHFLQISNPSNSRWQYAFNRADLLLKCFLQDAAFLGALGSLSIDDLSACLLPLNNNFIYECWRAEIACDIVGYELCSEIYLAKANLIGLIQACLIQALVEGYLKSRKKNSQADHPPFAVRSTIWAEFLHVHYQNPELNYLSIMDNCNAVLRQMLIESLN